MRRNFPFDPDALVGLLKPTDRFVPCLGMIRFPRNEMKGERR